MIPGEPLSHAPQQRVLIIDDERNVRQFLSEALEAEGYLVRSSGTARSGLSLAHEIHPDVVLLDQNLPDAAGLDILPGLRRVASNPAVVMITAYAAYPQAVAAIKSGASHYLTKPFDFSDLLQALAHVTARRVEADAPGLEDIVGATPVMMELKQRIARVARSPVDTVLVDGESGTGKELIARAIHALSPRAAGRFVAVNCAALSETLLLSELFGHERGAFTDARERKVGLFEAAQGGTLLLDEVGEMGAQAQAALLRALEQRTITRVGSVQEIPIDVRVVAATNRPLNDAVARGRFRADLFHRLNVVRAHAPPLRDRRDDILPLVHFFSRRAAARFAEPARGVSPAAARVLDRYDWPGNVRELRNAVEHAYVVASGPEIGPEGLPPELTETPVPAGVDGGARVYEALGFQDAKRVAIGAFERTYLEKLLIRSGGNLSRAAREAGVIRQVLQRLLKRHGLDRDEFVD
jgi:DNA-binding NtrC family response regulator